MEVLGFVAFLFVLCLAFWVLIFLMLFAPYMALLMILDRHNPVLAAKIAGVEYMPH
ncbi:MAG: hypothetical protein HRT72_10500 [Flavobacteriales bacterium]|nr:hypothetical protein [Flavobacteriales bacterium]